MGRWVGGNKDEEEHESGGLVYICEPKGGEDRLKYKFRYLKNREKRWRIAIIMQKQSCFAQNLGQTNLPANMNISISLERSYSCSHKC